MNDALNDEPSIALIEEPGWCTSLCQKGFLCFRKSFGMIEERNEQVF